MQLDKKTRIGVAEFKEINWLNINVRFSQCLFPSIYKFFKSESPEYFNGVYFSAEPSNINTRSSFQRLKQSKTKVGIVGYTVVYRFGTKSQLKLKGLEAQIASSTM